MKYMAPKLPVRCSFLPARKIGVRFQLPGAGGGTGERWRREGTKYLLCRWALGTPARRVSPLPPFLLEELDFPPDLVDVARQRQGLRLPGQARESHGHQ